MPVYPFIPSLLISFFQSSFITLNKRIALRTLMCNCHSNSLVDLACK